MRSIADIAPLRLQEAFHFWQALEGGPIVLRVHEGRLRYAGPRGSFGPELRAVCTEYCDELIHVIAAYSPHRVTPSRPWHQRIEDWVASWSALREKHATEKDSPMKASQ